MVLLATMKFDYTSEDLNGMQSFFTAVEFVTSGHKMFVPFLTPSRLHVITLLISNNKHVAPVFR